ncbi:MAG: nucleotidyltransferase domain-containing protein [Deltaproteobacteria bacterium]|nr:nucleotidyltransferase domain-containing protein [Candidatus Tharpella aukensis]
MLQDSLDLQLQHKFIEMICSAVSDCLAIYRFGSWGTVDQRPDSDIDLAVLALSPLDSVACWELAQQLASMAGRDVDLVDLLKASTVLRMQIVASGERFYCASANESEKFEDTVFSSYVRFNEERHLILEDVKKRGNVYG